METTTTDWLSDAIETATTTAIVAISSAVPGGASNSTGPSPVHDADPVSEGNYVLNTFIGLLIVLAASVLNALGLNLTKLDHQQQQGIPKRERRKEYLRPLWLGGMGIYIASQSFGSPLALRYLRPDWVAPLGASALVFNFLFAYWLVGTPVTPSDIRGTGLIVLGVILIVIFSSINHGLKQNLSIAELNRLWTRGSWVAYFIFLLMFMFATYVVTDLIAKVLRSRSSFSPLPSPTMGLPTSRTAPRESRFGACKRPIIHLYAQWKTAETIVLTHLERMFARTDDNRLLWLQGIGWAVAGGSLAGLCLVFTKAVVKTYFLPGHPMVHPSPLLTLLLTIATAVAQIICLNKALQCADTVVVVPLFYAGYTVFGFLNALIFYDQTGQYARWALIAVFLSISVLIGGVVLLSIKPTGDSHTVSSEPQDPAVRLRPRAATASQPSALGDANGEPIVPKHEGEENILWEVGSASEEENSDDEEDKSGKGIGGTSSSHGERGGLLLDVDDEDDEMSVRRSPATRPSPLQRRNSRAHQD